MVYYYAQMPYTVLRVTSALQDIPSSIKVEDPVMVYVTRSIVVEDLLKLYSNDDIVDQFSHVKFVGESGDGFGGLTKAF